MRTGAERRTARPSWEALVACIVFVVCAVAITAVWELLGDAVTDIALYQAYGERVAVRLVPVSYTHLTLPTILLV